MSLRIILNNYGPIKTANIELSDLTVLAGVNASGKSTIARLFHTLVEVNRNYNSKAIRAVFSVKFTKKLLDLSGAFQKVGVDASDIVRWVTDIHFEKPNALDDGWEKVYGSISEKCKLLDSNKNISEGDIRWYESLGRTIGESITSSEDVLKWFRGVMQSIKDLTKEYQEGKKSGWVYAVGMVAEDIDIYGDDRSELTVYDDKCLIFDKNKPDMDRSPIFSPDCSIYLKADRLSFPISEGVNGISVGKDIYRKPPVRDNEYSHTISDSLEQLMKGRLSKPIESSSINMEWYFSGVSRGNSYKIPLSKVADGMRSIAPLAILDKYNLLNSNTLLILDEPESHLHPQWIVDVAELLVRLVKERGVRVLVASHSPYLIRALKTASTATLAPGQLKYYLAKAVTEDGGDAGYEYEPLEENIAPIFKEFNVALDKISFYE